MNTRMQVTLPREQHLRLAAKARAAGMSMAEYIRQLVADDLEEPGDEAELEELFGIGDSGGSDVARHQDEYLGEALAGDG